MKDIHKIAEVLADVVKLIVEKPEAVSVIVTGSLTEGYVLTVTTDQSEIGKVIGKQGRMAEGLRTAVNAMGKSMNARISLDINDTH